MKETQGHSNRRGNIPVQDGSCSWSSHTTRLVSSATKRNINKFWL